MGETIIDFPLEGKEKKEYAWLIKTILVIALAASLVGLGAYLDRPAEKLPANAQCQTALDAAAKAVKQSDVQLAAALRGEEAPPADLASVRQAALDCKANIGIYTVTEEASK